MPFSSGLAASPAVETPFPKNRVHYRHPIQSLIYVRLDEGNGGIIRNLSQDGAAIQAVGALHAGQRLRVRFDLLNPRMRFDVHAEVSWGDPCGQAGLRFLDLNENSLRQLNDWIFVNLLRSLEHASPVLANGLADDLILSGSPLPPIPLAYSKRRDVKVQPKTAESFRLSWWPRPVSVQSLARFMDGVILFSAVLSFFCIFLAVTQTLPAWPITIALAAGVGGFFTALYWCLCFWLGCGTVGVQLGRIATRENASEANSREGESRFR
jgi:PilZ domain-containing protein